MNSGQPIIQNVMPVTGKCAEKNAKKISVELMFYLGPKIVNTGSQVLHVTVTIFF